ncbi:MAG: PilC/PilY family type IV pilus protein [Pseudomonadota bacterium]|nr:PilC/PilY family type IV pilus protein [Pseudomonadota bacterium]
MNMQKSKESSLQRGMRLPRPSRLSFALGLAVAVVTGAGHAATSFPDYPLQTNVGTVPPNIMFILDNSGSMNDLAMPDGIHEVFDRTFPGVSGRREYYPASYDDEKVYLSGINTIAYNPMIEYKPWRNADGSYKTLGLTPEAVIFNPNHRRGTDPTGQQYTVDLRDQDRMSYRTKYSKYTTDFLVLKAAGLDPESFKSYYRYRYDFNRNTWTRQEFIDGDRRDWRRKSTLWGEDGRFNNGAIEPAGNYGWHAIWDDEEEYWRRGSLLPSAPAYPKAWSDPVDVAVPLGVGGATPPAHLNSAAAQLKNYVTWYSYHRFRMSVAKAGASEAFYRLGSNYRVGFDTIQKVAGAIRRPDGTWTSGGDATIHNTPTHPIPVDIDDGRFEGVNKAKWFEVLHTQWAGGGTPLRSALARTGEYYETEQPWKDSSGQQLSCRRSYAILTTDGYWNGRFSGSFRPGDADSTPSSNYVPAPPYRDGRANTLADVAMYFWKNDLRPDLLDELNTTLSNPATWQHMVTFGVSIGLSGELDPKDPTVLQRLKTGALRWPDPRPDDTSSNSILARIDDLWHAAVNSRGEFVVASDADQFANALQNALDAIAKENGSGGGLGDTGRRVGGGSRIYQGRYQSGTWDGDVQAFAFSSGDTANAPQLWSLAQHTLNPDLFATGQGFSARPIFTWGQGGGGAPLSLAALGSKAALLARTSSSSAVSAIDNLNYLKGDRSLEKANGGHLRDRPGSLIGDIVNSVPEYVAENDSLFVGANDGMLHAINAVNGRPLFSYMPRGIDYRALATLSDPYYQHRFFVDGIPRVSRRSITAGKNILVSSLGRGGRGLFALDVTNPASFSAANVLWDEDHTVNADIGYILSQPLIVPGNHGGTLMITANGLESQGGNAKVLVYELNAAGQVTARRAFGQTGGSGNGMTSFTAYDRNADGKVDIVYAGDIQGNVWKIDLSGGSAASWGVANGGSPMFTARDASGAVQPITGGLTVTVERRTGRAFISFGTGKYLSEQDKDVSGTLQTQTLYTLIDGNTPVTGRAQLQQRTFPYVGTSADGRAVRGAENYSELPASARGWYLDLGVPASLNRGERIVTRPELSGELLAVATLVPGVSEGCSPGLGGSLIALNVFTGTNPKGDGYFDFNGDGMGDKIPGTQGHISSVDLGRGTGGVRLYRNEDGSLSAVTPGLDGSLLTTKLLGGGSRGERVNWRELVRSN